MCVKSFELVKEDMGEVVAWKVFNEHNDGELFSLIHSVINPFPINEWIKEKQYRPRIHNHLTITMEGYPFGFMSYTSKKEAKAANWCGTIRKVIVRDIVAVAKSRRGRNYSLPRNPNIYIAREMLILPDEA